MFNLYVWIVKQDCKYSKLGRTYHEKEAGVRHSMENVVTSEVGSDDVAVVEGLAKVLELLFFL